MTPILAAIAGIAALVFAVLFLQAKALAEKRSNELLALRSLFNEKDEEVRVRAKTERDLSSKNREALERAAKLEEQLKVIKVDHGKHGAPTPQDSKAAEALNALKTQISAAKAELALLAEAVDLTDIAFYAPSFREADSEAYRNALDQNIDRQKAMLRAGSAAVCTKVWTVGGDAKAGERMVKAITKLALRAFNGESDASIARVTWKNIDTMRKRVQKSHDAINELVEHWNIVISKEFLALKLDELQLVYEQEEMRQRERDEQRELKEQMREEERARAEVERAKHDAEREERMAEQALARARIEIAKASDDERAAFQIKLASLETQLAEARANAERAISMAQMTKRGNVYIISNVGSFGEGVFKIGLTRRIVPQDRVDELGVASVPFDFDVHGFIESKDAPKLEGDFHRHFAMHRVNLVNVRKEFFRVSISEIQTLCLSLGISCQLTRLAEAKEFRQSEAMRRTDQAKNAPRENN